MHCRLRTSWSKSTSEKGVMPIGMLPFNPQRSVFPGFALHSERLIPVRGLLESAEGLGMAEALQEATEVAEIAEVAIGDMEGMAKVVEYGDIASPEEMPVLPAEILDEPILEDVAPIETEEEESQGSARTMSLALLNMMTLLMASNGVVVKNAEAFVDPYTFSALRFFVSSLTFAPFLLSAGPKVLDKAALQAGLEIGFWSTLGYLFQTVGLELIDASKAGFLGGMFVVIVPILAGLSGKGISKVTWAGTALSVLGASLLEEGSSSGFGLGDVYCLLSATFFSIQMLRTETFTKSLPPGSTLPILSVATLTTSIISAVLVVSTHPTESLSLLHALSAHTLDGQSITTYIQGLPWKEISYTGIFSTALVLFIEMAALRNVTSTDAAIIYSIEPVLAGVLAFIFLGEHWAPVGWAGAAVIVAASIGTQLLNVSPESEHDIDVQMSESD